jgi:hypothetical protein
LYFIKKKAKLREDWLGDMIKIVNETALATNTSQIETTLERHKAISTDILARVIISINFLSILSSKPTTLRPIDSLYSMIWQKI